jgi:hypothetical protein
MALLPGADLLLHRLPEAPEEAPGSDLDDAIIGGKALLKACPEQSFDWARIYLLLAKLYCEHAAAACTTIAKYAALTEAQHYLACALLVFRADASPKSFREATQLGQEIGKALDALIISGCEALLKRCLPRSLDWARAHVLLMSIHTYAHSSIFCSTRSALWGGIVPQIGARMDVRPLMSCTGRSRV